MNFPKNFLWGAATSAHQVEGGNRNDWSEWEKANAERLAREAEARYEHLPSWPMIKDRAADPLNYISGRACDHYHRFQEDFDIAKSLGHTVHRFSIEWSRIEPYEGEFDEKEITHYKEVIRALRARGMEPFVVLWHWTIPLWLRDKGGIESPQFPFYFKRYVGYVVGALGNDVTYWMTLNEPTSVIGNAYMKGIWPPQKKNIFAALKAYRMLAKAHREAFHEIHRISSRAKVGFGNIMVFFEPFRRRSLDSVTVFFLDLFSNRYFLWLTRNTHDYFALQYYFHAIVRFPHSMENENKKRSDMGWELYPEGLYVLILRLAKYKKPIFVTEHGLADGTDTHRSWFIREGARHIARAIAEGADVRGYFYWSLLDNFEWDKGFWPRFGLVEVDYATLERKIRPSAFEYKKIIESSSQSSF